MKLSKLRTGFDIALSGIMEPLWLELPITRIHFDSLFEFETQMFYCILILPFLLSEETAIYCLEIVRKFMSIQNKGTIFVRNGLSKQDRQDHFDSKGF